MQSYLFPKRPVSQSDHSATWDIVTQHLPAASAPRGHSSNHHTLAGLKQHTPVIVQFWRSECKWSHWAEIKVSLGWFSLGSPVAQGGLNSRARGPFPRLLSPQCRRFRAPPALPLWSELRLCSFKNPCGYTASTWTIQANPISRSFT